MYWCLCGLWTLKRKITDLKMDTPAAGSTLAGGFAGFARINGEGFTNPA
jgi:hypothetical protein